MTAQEPIEIKPATLADAEGISRMVIRTTLRETNSQDYAPEIIDALVSNYSPERVALLIANRRAYVAITHAVIVGTASLQDSAIRTVFVDPDYQANGIGTRLVDMIEKVARASSIPKLNVPSSLTAEGFYRKLGYHAVREELHGHERTIIMEKHFPLQLGEGQSKV